MRRRGCGHVPGKGFLQDRVAHHPTLHKLEQVDEQLVTLEQGPQGKPPGSVGHVNRGRFVREEQAEPGPDGGFRVLVSGRRQQFSLLRAEQEHEVHRGFFQERTHPLPVLRDDRVRRERHAEHLAGIFAQGGRVRVAAQGCGGAGANQVFTGNLEAGTQPPQEQGQVGALGAVEGMQFVHHHVAQGGRRVVLPELAVLGPQHQEVQHLVVGKQDVGRVLAQGIPVGDNTGCGHDRPLTGLAGLAPDIETDAQAGEGGNRKHLLRNAPRLVGGQGIHGINH